MGLYTRQQPVLSGSNPGALAAAARLYEHLAYTYPAAPDAERWAWLAAWYYARAAGSVCPARNLGIEVEFHDLAAGDVLEAGKWASRDDSERHEIVTISAYVDNCTPRWAYVRNVATGEVTPRIFQRPANAWGWCVSAGLKVEAVANGQAWQHITQHPTIRSAYRWSSAAQ